MARGEHCAGPAPPDGDFAAPRYIRPMCGRATYKLTWEEIVALYRLTLDQPPVNTRARYNVCPTHARRGVPYRGEHCQAAKRAAADIEGHSATAQFGQPRRLIGSAPVVRTRLLRPFISSHRRRAQCVREADVAGPLAAAVEIKPSRIGASHETYENCLRRGGGYPRRRRSSDTCSRSCNRFVHFSHWQ